MGKQVGIAEFKAKCIALMDEVSRTGEPLTVTRRGKRLVQVEPAAEAEPVKPEKRRSAYGLMKSDTYRFDVAPEQPAIPLEDWNVLR